VSFLRGLSVNAVAVGLAFALAFANSTWVARILGKEGLGHLAVAVTTVTVAGMVFGEWLTRGNSYHSGRDDRHAGSVWRNTTVYTLSLLPVLAVLAWVASVFYPEYVPRRQALLMAPMTAGVVAQKGFSGILQGRDRLTAFALVPLFFVSTYFLLNLVGLGWLELGLNGALAAWLCGVILSASLAAVFSRGAGGVDGGLLRSTMAVGGRGAMSATLIYLLFRSDIYLVEHYLGTETLGVYYIAVFIAEMIQRGPNIAGAVLLPKVLRGTDDDHTMSLAVSRAAFLFSLAAAAGVIAGGRQAIGWVYGMTYAGAHTPLVWMLPGLIACGFASVLNTKLAGQGYPPVTMWAPGAALAMNVGLNLILIPRFGLVGAALSTSIAYVLWAAIVTVAYQRLTGLAWGRFVRVSA
jgi:O-antigen/teichoic acid export membrane protein